MAGTAAISLTARWLDLDQDGDLDLYVVNYTDRAATPTRPSPTTDVPRAGNSAYRNDGKPRRDRRAAEDNWAPLAVAPTDLPANGRTLDRLLTLARRRRPARWRSPRTRGSPRLDLDDDRDLDLVLCRRRTAAPVAVLNDRLGRFHARRRSDGLDAPERRLRAARRRPRQGRPRRPRGRRPARDASPPGGTRPSGRPQSASDHLGALARPTPGDWRAAVAADLDLDTWPDLVGLPAIGRRPRARLGAGTTAGELDGDPARPRPGDAEAAAVARASPWPTWSATPLPDLLLVGDGEAARLARNLGNGQHWLALDLGGPLEDQLRPHAHQPARARGPASRSKGRGSTSPTTTRRPQAGLAQSVGPVVLGLGPSTVGRPRPAPLARRHHAVRAERRRPTRRSPLAEHNRKTGSCPVLFTWNGERFVCLGDFLGGGGLGYLVAPGVYGQPDRDEAVAIAPDQLKPVDGVYRLVDHRADGRGRLSRQARRSTWSTAPRASRPTPDERFAPGGPRPTGETPRLADADRAGRARPTSKAAT